jgi:dUTP pyrophosphatase
VTPVPVACARVNDTLTLPAHARPGDAGLDLRAGLDITIPAGGRRLVPTGIHIAIPDGHAGYVLPRSGLALQHGVTVLNAPGLIDSGYRGEIGVLLVNTDHDRAFDIAFGDRVAQLVIAPVVHVELFAVDLGQLPESPRAADGFGSTGKT